jgi:hypothetical protein
MCAISGVDAETHRKRGDKNQRILFGQSAEIGRGTNPLRGRARAVMVR